MSQVQGVLEYKCPCCGAALVFSSEEQQLTCASCGNSLNVEDVKQYNETLLEQADDSFEWEQVEAKTMTDDEANRVVTYTCPACGGQIMGDPVTAATFCPYCDSPAIIGGNLSGTLRPDAVIPFKTTKETAMAAFAKLCKGKPLLPKDYASTARQEKIQGIYVPFWLYDCNGRIHGRYKATRVHTWSDANYIYTRTSHFLLMRKAVAAFQQIPLDASVKMDDATMESIEPFDMSEAVDFSTAYLSGFFADKYDVEAMEGEPRIRQRVSDTFEDLLAPTFIGYSSVIPTSRQIHVDHTKANYVLLPVWMLHTSYKGKTYIYAMNGQTGKMTGTLPIDKGRMWAWFFGITAGVAALIGTFFLLGM